ncbi:GLPGLI family protein [Polaribacter butkevichii]|uniref:GLPGLI family protein n=1 Tax=Polaribacter butkevichii TaxID=218490 RepID=A0A2P6C7A5_9FLAO|nr:GLPGLI family protein [Polaribacter butkevichii]PQJ68800.1 hypothetical protein BTO14_12180 [Polaribacter butkevichii]
MKRIIILILLFSNIYSLKSQSSSGNVEYKSKIDGSYIKNDLINKEKDENLKNTLIFLNSSLKNNQNKFVFTLNFNRNESVYFMNKILNIDNDRQMKYAIIMNGGNKTFYQDIKNHNVIYKTNVFGEEFNVRSSLYSIKWELTREEKKIGNYKCYKATTFLNKKTKIEAWYSPEIPFSFGPKGFGGLPGLIIELKENNIIYYANKITLNKEKEFAIEFPEKEKIISKEKFDSIGKSAKYKMSNY